MHVITSWCLKKKTRVVANRNSNELAFLTANSNQLAFFKN